MAISACVCMSTLNAADTIQKVYTTIKLTRSGEGPRGQYRRLSRGEVCGYAVRERMEPRYGLP